MLSKNKEIYIAIQHINGDRAVLVWPNKVYSYVRNHARRGWRVREYKKTNNMSQENLEKILSNLRHHFEADDGIETKRVTSEQFIPLLERVFS